MSLFLGKKLKIPHFLKKKKYYGNPILSQHLSQDACVWVGLAAHQHSWLYMPAQKSN
jgi:hypothetical protein